MRWHAVNLHPGFGFNKHNKSEWPHPCAIIQAMQPTLDVRMLHLLFLQLPTSDRCATPIEWNAHVSYVTSAAAREQQPAELQPNV